jgi:antitoxin YefM
LLKIRLDLATAKTYVSLGGDIMNIVNATEARSKLYSLIDEAAASHQPIVITGKRSNAVLISEEDWNSISETLYLLSIPGMRESIKQGIEQDLSECEEGLDW